jgi:putative MATE family efflux protein
MELKADYKSILKISGPLILANLVSGVGQIIDTAFINRVGEKELNGTVLAGMVWMFFSFISIGFSTYFQRNIANKIGAKQTDEIPKIADNTVIVYVFILILIGIVYGLLRFFGLSFMIQDHEIVAYAFIYLDILMLFIPVLLCISFTSAFFAAKGQTYIITKSVIVYIVSNLILDYLLIFGNLGFPKWGVLGSGLATGLALVASFANYIYYTYKNDLVRQYQLFVFQTIDWSAIKEIISKSIPLVLQNIFHMLSYWVFFMMIEKMGSMELRVSLIVRSLYLFLCLPIFGLGKAINTVVSNFLGKKDLHSVDVAIKRSHQISFVISLILSSLILFLPDLLLRIYTDDLELIAQALPTLKVLAVSVILFSISTVNINIIIAIGITRSIFIFSMISITGYLSFAYLAIFQWKLSLPAVWYSDWINWGIFTFLSTVFFFMWKRKQSKINSLVQ